MAEYDERLARQLFGRRQVGEKPKSKWLEFLQSEKKIQDLSLQEVIELMKDSDITPRGYLLVHDELMRRKGLL